MEHFNDRLRYATGFVKPKTTAILFEKIVVTDDLLDEGAASLGYSYIPNEVLFSNSVSKEKFLKSKFYDNAPMPISRFMFSGELAHYINDMDFVPHIMENEPIGEASFFDYILEGAKILSNSQKEKEDCTPKYEFKYSVNRNNGIASIYEQCLSLGISVVPVFFSPTDYEKQYIIHSDTSQNVPAISLCINNLPEIIEDKLDWEQVLEIRADEESTARIRRLKNWLNTDILHKKESEMKAILDKAIDDYGFALKKHGIQTLVGAISTVTTASHTLINAVSQNGSFDVAGLSIASGLSVFAIKSWIDKAEAKRHPIALIYDLMK